MSRLWDKGEAVDEMVLRFTVGGDYLLDRRLLPYDVRASQAHARTLAKAGYLTQAEADEVCTALGQVASEFGQGGFDISLEDEDVHTALENRLVEKCGELGKKIHLGRSRNDQVLVALRLYYLDVIAETKGLVAGLEDALDSLAQKGEGLSMPGYTHMQRAMPSNVSDWIGAYRSELRDSTLALDLAGAHADQCPLGSAAGYGTPGLALDRAFTAQELGFARAQEPVTACQLSRGKAESALAFALVTLLQDLGRLASDLCLFSTAEFGFVSLPKAFTTGSSIMPQKRNPDVFELVRAHSAQAPSLLAAILATTTRLTSGYHRDLQLLKAPLFELIDTAQEVFEIMSRALPALNFDGGRLGAAMTPDLYAAQQAFELVKTEGLSFREAYVRVAASLTD
ncbi:MAG: argininosuccinate lyase [Armatimonadetes bacterium]|nr:argininosuccinate lyase [Armatimonadota bacterium]